MSEFASSSVEVTDYRVNAATNEEKEKLKELKIQFTDKLNSKKDKTAIEKEKIIDLEGKINTRRKTFFKS